MEGESITPCYFSSISSHHEDKQIQRCISRINLLVSARTKQIEVCRRCDMKNNKIKHDASIAYRNSYVRFTWCVKVTLL